MPETITLYQFPRPGMVANLGFFCMKVEVFMRMTSIPYHIEEIFNPAQAPKGKLPYVIHQGQKIPDSSHIIEYLTSHFSITLNDHLNQEQLAIGHAVKIMLEERLRWCIVYSRWLDKRYSPSFQHIFLDLLPFPLRIIFPLLATKSKKRITTTLNSNGIGKFTPEEIYAFGNKDIDAVATIVGNQPYLLGEQPSSYDAIAYSFLANLIDVPIECPLNTFARDRETLRNYCQRMKSNYFSDL
ncbi:glutathione S-transferase family protein [Pleurocapsa sp. PCC 7319]|uniref:glutathione S-transferase family protein n=1 Tax=Pleurocapsa sp. PCC 7319 TaxID=118161 RepID=UPI00034BE9BF|nr:glutathione S-transferase family protein [Pleurocapsa sp. PCC 7319]